MKEVTIKLRQEDVRRIQSLVLEAYWESQKIFDRLNENQMDIPLFLFNAISDKKRILEILEAAMHQQPSSARKDPAVDREKLLMGLEYCWVKTCDHCPYGNQGGCFQLAFDSLEYIGYLEKQLEEAGKA